MSQQGMSGGQNWNMNGGIGQQPNNNNGMGGQQPMGGFR
jgi:hypothetical protein